MEYQNFNTLAGFCPDCGDILPISPTKNEVRCFTCLKKHGLEVFENTDVEFTIYFNSTLSKQYLNEESEIKRNQGIETEGPIVERKCKKCGNDKMAYATLQLRSADEGQTVFYTCTKCKYKETENS